VGQGESALQLDVEHGEAEHAERDHRDDGDGFGAIRSGAKALAQRGVIEGGEVAFTPRKRRRKTESGGIRAYACLRVGRPESRGLA
jgi:hypothetical protein